MRDYCTAFYFLEHNCPRYREMKLLLKKGLRLQLSRCFVSEAKVKPPPHPPNNQLWHQ